MFEQASWISSSAAANENRLYRFRKTVFLSDIAGIRASLCADSRYKLYINGHYVCEGPCIGTARYFDTVDISPFLQVGENRIEAEVLYLGGTNGASCINRRNRVAFVMEASQGDRQTFTTDASWECAADDSRRFYLAKIHPNGYLNEEYAYQPLCWDPAVVLCRGSGSQEWGVLPKYEVTESPLRLYTPSAPREMAVSKTDMGTCFRIAPGETRYVIFALEKLSVGYPEFTFRGAGNVSITYAEAYAFYDETDRYYRKRVRTDKNGEIVGASDHLHLTEGTMTFRPFLTKTARFLKVEVTAVSDFEIQRAQFLEYRYPLEIRNRFHCSDPEYDRIFQVSVQTLEDCMLDTYVDCPYYEMQQYSEDAYLEMMYTFMLSDDHAMPRKLLTDLWQSHNYEGMLLAAAPMEYRQITPTFCFFWILMLEQYIRYTGDTDTVRPMLPGVYGILSWFGNYVDGTGVVGVYPYGKFIDWVKTWKSGFYVDGAQEKATSIATLMYLHGLKTGADLFRRFGKEGTAEDLIKEYARVKAAANRLFYDEKEGMYRDTVGGGFSEHSQIWAVLSGAIEGPGARRALLGCEGPDVHRCSYSYRFFKNRAMEQCGMQLDMEAFLEDWKAMLALDASTWFEFPGNARSDCHAWSSVPIYEFTAGLLGVSPRSDGFQKVTVEPHFGKLTYASGTVPTPMGDLSVSWRREQDQCLVEIRGPAGMEKTLMHSGIAIASTWNAELTATFPIVL